MMVASVVVALLGVETTMVPLVAPMVAPVASVALVHHGGTMVHHHYIGGSPGIFIK